MKKNEVHTLEKLILFFLTKNLLKMKLCFLCLLISISQLYASQGYSQSKLLTLNLKDVTVEKALSAIENETNIYFIYNRDDVDVSRKVDLECSDRGISDILKDLFAGTNVVYKFQDGHIILKSALQSNIQQKKINVSGKVSDSSGSSLPGVTIAIKGKSNGTITDAEGRYRLTDIASDATLIFSFVGMKSQEILVRGKTQINVVLEADAIDLDEVVAVGYGTMKKSDLTGSVSSINSDQFKIGSDLTPQQIMKGSISGVNISQNSGKPGGTSTIRVRGGTSISASNDPLYVIDGVPISTSAGVSSTKLNSDVDYFDEEAVDPLSSLNPNDIESINILKDASATAIYGSRGANGVIMITTKRGKAGSTQLNYSFNSGLSEASKQLDVLTGDEYRSVVNSLDLTLDDKGDNANWQDRIEQIALSTNHFLSLAGGSAQSNYRVSFGYGDQEGVIKASEVKKYNTRINLTHKELDGKLKFDVNISYGQQKNDQSPISNTVGSEMGSCILYEAYVFNPTYPIYDEDGDYYDVPSYRVNPVSYTTELLDERKSTKFLGNVSASYNFVKPLTFQINVGYNSNTVDRNSYISKDNLLGDGYEGYVSIQKLSDYNKLLETILKYKKEIGKNSINAMAGYSYQYFYDEGNHESAYGFLSDVFKWYSIQAATTIEIPSSYAECNKLISMYGRINYDYDHRYLFTATLRRDGSSRFGSDHKWGLFPSVALSWRISQEKFYRSRFVSNLKFRSSYGITGSQEIGNYNSLNTLSASSSGYIVGGSKVTIVMPAQYSNPDLKWEQTAQVDLGIDFGLFKERIQGSVDWYSKKTTDLLLDIDVPSPSYISTQTANVGSVRNRGIEFSLNADLVRNRNFGWSVNFNLSHNVNKVLSLSNDKWVGDDIQTAPCQGQGLSGTYAQLINYSRGTIGNFLWKAVYGLRW